MLRTAILIISLFFFSVCSFAETQEQVIGFILETLEVSDSSELNFYMFRSRDCEEYLRLLSMGEGPDNLEKSLNDLSSCSESECYCDFGCGYGSALKGFKIPVTRKIGIDDTRELPRTENFYFINQSVETVTQEELKARKVVVATDLFGPLHYSLNPLETLKKELSLLETNGKLYTNLDKKGEMVATLIDTFILLGKTNQDHRVRTLPIEIYGVAVVKLNGQIISFRDWLFETSKKSESGFEVMISKDANAVLIKKTAEKINLPRLDTVLYRYSTPPVIVLSEHNENMKSFKARVLR